VTLRGRTALLFALGLVVSGFTILRGIGPHDEGLMLQWAQRISVGQWPYRDFWSNYPPGQAVFLAGLTKVFGPSLLPWRIVRVLLDALVGVFAYRLIRRWGEEWIALLGWLAAVTAMAWPTGPGPNPTALALGLGAVLLAGQRQPRLVWAGVLCGLAVFVRLEIGVACLIACAMTAPAGSRWRPVWPAALVAGAALLPFAIAAGGAMWHQTLGFLGDQSLQREPLLAHYAGGPDPNRLLEWAFPALLLVLLGVWAVWWVRRRPPAAAWALFPLALFGLAYLLGRTDEFHLVPLSLALAVLLGVAASREFPGVWRWVLVVALAVIAVHGTERRIGEALHPIPSAAVPGGVGDGVTTDVANAAALRRAIPLIRSLSPPGGTILVVPPRTDRVTVGDPLLYVLTRRRNPTRYDVMQPGVVTKAGAQRSMIADLERARTPVLVRWNDPQTAPEDNGAGHEHGSRLLDAYLDAHYRLVRRDGPYAVYQRRFAA
jgi:hypothetical protein